MRLENLDPCKLDKSIGIHTIVKPSYTVKRRVYGIIVKTGVVHYVVQIGKQIFIDRLNNYF